MIGTIIAAQSDRTNLPDPRVKPFSVRPRSDNMIPKTPALVDAAKLEKVHAAFQRPSEKEISRLKTGMLVKISLVISPENNCYGERLWGEIVGLNPSGFTVRIDNEPCLSDKHGIQFNDLILVARDNVFAIHQDETPRAGLSLFVV